jgi:FixJ family two-component response regulator
MKEDAFFVSVVDDHESVRESMPVMSGPELRRELLTRGHFIPTIFISAHAEFAAQPDVRGAAACLVKPFTDKVLLESLRRALDFTSTD